MKFTASTSAAEVAKHLQAAGIKVTSHSEPNETTDGEVVLTSKVHVQVALDVIGLVVERDGGFDFYDPVDTLEALLADIASADITPGKYAFIAYKSNSDDSCMGCHVASYSSDLELQTQLNQQQLVDVWAGILNRNMNLDINELGYEVTVLENGIPVDLPEIKSAAEAQAAALQAEQEESKRIAAEQKKQQEDQVAAEQRRQQYEKLRQEFESQGQTK